MIAFAKRIERFQTRPEEVQAVRWDGSQEALLAIDKINEDPNLFIRVASDQTLLLDTIFIEHRVSVGSYVVRWVDKRLLVFSPDEFARHFELLCA